MWAVIFTYSSGSVRNRAHYRYAIQRSGRSVTGARVGEGAGQNK